MVLREATVPFAWFVRLWSQARVVLDYLQLADSSENVAKPITDRQ